MISPFDDKACPTCKKRQLLSLSIDASIEQLGCTFFYCDQCLEVFATEAITDSRKRMDIAIFYGLKSKLKETIKFWETLSEILDLLEEFLVSAAKSRSLMLLTMHAAIVLKRETISLKAVCKERIGKLKKIGEPKRKRTRFPKFTDQ